MVIHVGSVVRWLWLRLERDVGEVDAAAQNV